MFGCQYDDIFTTISMKTKHQDHIMTFGMVVTRNDDAIPRVISPYGLTLNTEDYVNVKVVVLFWVARVATGRPYDGQRVSVPHHTSKRTQC